MLLLTPNSPAIDQPESLPESESAGWPTAPVAMPLAGLVTPPTGGVRVILRAPGLTVVAALCILQGYLWLGFIPSDSLHHGLAAVILASVAAVLAFTKPPSPIRRSPLERSALVGPAVLAAASLLHPLRTGSSLCTAGGIADLLAATVLVSLVGVGEWRRRRAASSSAVVTDFDPAPSIPVA